MNTTFDWLRTKLAQDYSLDTTALVPGAALEALGLDSLAVAELLFNVEDKFHIKISSESAPLATLGDVARFIDEQIARQHSPDATSGIASKQASP
ncbi:acyl carrier protein [Caballeronia humi]|uniref:Acyl carrier protein n=1 Tax=Caballeronia humi TaxID=326474 RepID=A0A158JFU9_9BURK|nr:phosphopantetheine-binding protein [Caballeronia humi]SAL67339.1 Acyl carrier protein [Caballeronia humi]